MTVETRDSRFVRDCQKKFPLHRYHRLAPLMHELRAVKSQYEIDAIKAACDLTGKGFERVCKFVKPGVNETEVEAEFAHEFIRHKGQFAYPPIIAGGANNNILHYNQNDQPCKKGDLLLLDVAAGLGNYMSDLTRTIPVSGKFHAPAKTGLQRRAAHLPRASRRAGAGQDDEGFADRMRGDAPRRNALISACSKCRELKKQKPDNPAVRKFFMHGVSHPIGLDVHDVTYNHFKIAPGWVLTVEPAIYIKEEGFGVRLENTVLVTENGQLDLMADIPIEADEIEDLMNRRK